jgi:hypothetical protein
MVAAGVVAGARVLTGSSILVVGAMAISPDLLPMASAAVGVVDRRPGLAVRAFLTRWAWSSSRWLQQARHCCSASTAASPPRSTSRTACWDHP